MDEFVNIKIILRESAAELTESDGSLVKPE